LRPRAGSRDPTNHLEATATACNTRPVLSLEREPVVKSLQCDRCGRAYSQVTLFVYRDGDAFAICYATLHGHDGTEETWFDVILGPLDQDEHPDRVTFGCRVGLVPGQEEPGATLTAGGVPFSNRPLFGRKLSREDALAHPLLADFWEVVDLVLATDPTVREHVFG
jgi:hypothetical protein